MFRGEVGAWLTLSTLIGFLTLAELRLVSLNSFIGSRERFRAIISSDWQSLVALGGN